MSQSIRYQGKITSWNDERGFGFMTPNGGDYAPVFVHVRQLPNRRRPNLGDSFSFNIGSDEQGRPCAVGVQLPRTAPRSAPAHPSILRYGGFGLAIVLYVGLAGLCIGYYPYWAAGALAAVNLVTFALYRHDKRAAQRNEWRVAERTLHLFELLGGWPAALAAQQALRHKSRKATYQTVFRLMIFLNLMGLYALSHPTLIH